MIYKPEVVVDLDTGAIVQAEVHPGDQADHKEMATRVLESQQTINPISGEEFDTLTVTSITSDKGYYSVSELQALQEEGVRTVIRDPIDNRRVDKLAAPEQRAVRAATKSVKSQSGKGLLRRRGMHIERSFAHILGYGPDIRQPIRDFSFSSAAYTVFEAKQENRSFGFSFLRRASASSSPEEFAVGLPLHQYLSANLTPVVPYCDTSFIVI